MNHLDAEQGKHADTAVTPKFPRIIREAFEHFPNVRSDRQIMSGAPCVAGRRIPVHVLAGRFAAGDNIGFIATDYDLKPEDVRDAIRFVCWCSKLGDVKWWKFYQ